MPFVQILSKSYHFPSFAFLYLYFLSFLRMTCRYSTPLILKFFSVYFLRPRAVLHNNSIFINSVKMDPAYRSYSDFFVSFMCLMTKKFIDLKFGKYCWFPNSKGLYQFIVPTTCWMLFPHIFWGVVIKLLGSFSLIYQSKKCFLFVVFIYLTRSKVEELFVLKDTFPVLD